jgi:gliding motility associated protien GldN
MIAQEGFSQQPPTRTRQRPSEVQVDKTPALTDRAKIKNTENSKEPVRVVWLREIYRNIDLTKENNAALLYPPQPLGNRQNLCTLIFKLIADNKVTAYKYYENERLVDSEIIDFEEILTARGIIHTSQGAGENKKIIIEETDIPSSEVLQYMIKEAWYFDEATGSFKSQIKAICPILVQEDFDIGGFRSYALFWIPYENLRPYLSREMIMTSDYNNALSYTIDDYFTKRMFSGDIVKTVNMRNLTLSQQVGSDNLEALKHAQDSIESQLKDFEKQLWVQEDTTVVATAKQSQKTSSKSEKPKKEEKPKESKVEKSSAAPTKSVRRTR